MVAGQNSAQAHTSALITALRPFAFLCPFLPPAGWNGWFAPYKDITINFNWGSNVIGALDAAGEFHTEAHSQRDEAAAGSHVASKVLKAAKLCSAICAQERSACSPFARRPPRSRPPGNRVPLPNAMPASLSIITLAFAAGECGAETWAGVSVAAVQNTIQALIRANKRYIISTGGAAGKFMCGSAVGMATFMSRYYTPYMVGLDFGETENSNKALVCSAGRQGAEGLAGLPPHAGRAPQRRGSRRARCPDLLPWPLPRLSRPVQPLGPPCATHAPAAHLPHTDIEVGQTQAEITALVQRAYELRLTYPTLKIG